MAAIWKEAVILIGMTLFLLIVSIRKFNARLDEDFKVFVGEGVSPNLPKPQYLKMIVAIPIVQLLIMPLAADYEIKNINVSIVDHDRSSYSRQLTQKITASGYFRLTDYTYDYRLSFENFESDQSDLILEIPNGFERNLIKENQSGLFLAVNAINGTKASVGSSYLSRIIQDFNTDIRVD